MFCALFNHRHFLGDSLHISKILLYYAIKYPVLERCSSDCSKTMRDDADDDDSAPAMLQYLRYFSRT